MTRQDDYRAARATLTYLGARQPGTLLQFQSPAQVLASISSGAIPARAARTMNCPQHNDIYRRCWRCYVGIGTASSLAGHLGIPGHAGRGFSSRYPWCGPYSWACVRSMGCEPFCSTERYKASARMSLR
jgi:hypothetical protein